MADLLTELQHFASAVTARRRVPETDPLLLDEVYTCKAAQDSPNHDDSDYCSSSRVSASGRVSQAASMVPAVQQSSSSFTSGATNFNSLAALAAYKRQLYLGLDPNAAPGTAGPGGSRPVSAAPSLQAAVAGRRNFALKSRPNGMSSPDFGSGHVPGLLPRPDVQDTAAPCIPAQSGMGPIIPPKLYQRSCCPPPWPEPLTAAAEDGPGIVTARQADRELLDEQLLNRLVYDSLQPAAPSTGRSDCADSTGSSCRTTISSKSLNVGTCAGAEGSKEAAHAEEQHTAQQPDAHVYAPSLTSWYTLEGASDATLVFESRFESGNLRRAIQVTDYEYDLVLQPDINTRGHTQWFFFAVSNTRAGKLYRFNIINLLKEDSTYNMGMLPLMHSERQMRIKGVGWVRCGSNVAYGVNNIVCRKKQTYYTLTFTVEFPYDQDLVHLAHCYPFTWTDQQNHIYALKKSPPPNTIVQQTTLATSLAGNTVDLLTITAAPEKGKPLAQRLGVVLSARVHPGETNSSWMMKGALQQLLADTEEAAQLRETFVFKVVPMLNPDGVIVGNYRCSLAGLDLNRVYQAPDSRLQPVICAFKEMVRAFTQEREVVLSCDMHGHSRRFGIFMYGCEKKPGKDLTPVGPGYPAPGSLGGLPCVPSRHQERIFPLMLALNAPDLFSYRSCNFKVQKSKSGTGRVVGFRELGLVNAYTMEASFAGAAVGKYAKQHFTTGHLEEMGSAVVRTLLDYWAPAELNSAPDLCAQLDAALLQGVTDSSGPSSGSAGNGSAGSAALGSAFEKLGLGDAGDDEDICTDSDDESSDDDKPAVRPVSSRPAQQAGAERAVGGTGDRDEVGGTAGAESLADISRQLTELLSSTLAAAVDGSKAAGVKGAAAGSNAAVGAVKNLLDAINASETAGSTVAATPAAADRARSVLQGPAPVSNSSSANAGVAVPASGSSKLLASTPTQSVTAAAQQLLEKLAVAKAKVQAGATVAAAVSTSAMTPVALTAVDAVGPAVPAPAAVTKAVLPAAAGTAADEPQPSASAASGATSIPTPAAAAVSAAAMAGGVADPLSEEEATLLVLPGLPEILEKLVQQTTQQKLKAASTGKKKGRRKGRWGNPEVLRAARAFADAGLAAALPELGINTALADEQSPTAAPSWWDEGGSCSSSSSLSTPATPSVPDRPDPPMAGRRARTAGSRSGKGAALNAERYMYCLEVQKRAVGGVLASSSTDPAGESGGLTSPSSQHPGSLASTSSPFGSSKSIGRGTVMFAGADEQPDALESAVAAGGAAATVDAARSTPGSPPGTTLQPTLRSKPAYPWLAEQQLQTG